MGRGDGGTEGNNRLTRAFIPYSTHTLQPTAHPLRPHARTQSPTPPGGDGACAPSRAPVGGWVGRAAGVRGEGGQAGHPRQRGPPLRDPAPQVLSARRRGRRRALPRAGGGPVRGRRRARPRPGWVGGGGDCSRRFAPIVGGKAAEAAAARTGAGH